ncbi:hypothetical protein ACX80J_14425 [Arthrobacter sp. MDB2-24]
MNQDGSGQALHTHIVDAMERAHITAHELWLYYFSIGGSVNELEVTAYLHALMPLPALD